ncbi:hypothetical protein EYF80_036623 [Liparis tanakae]|uniref:Uncharacterized protein n=1 Tax=Liparis tanakae TaxID=230148 RepID=A0A4Z2GKA7_9TELE|nr:hypothetical protein EYF80_036623 [Liparis tanakae]
MCMKGSAFKKKEAGLGCRTCSREAGCMAAGLWVKEEDGVGPEEVESSFRPELPGVSALSFTLSSSLPPSLPPPSLRQMPVVLAAMNAGQIR